MAELDQASGPGVLQVPDLGATTQTIATSSGTLGTNLAVATDGGGFLQNATDVQPFNVESDNITFKFFDHPVYSP